MLKCVFLLFSCLPNARFVVIKLKVHICTFYTARYAQNSFCAKKWIYLSCFAARSELNGKREIERGTN
jgi:hypothetical protein